MPKKIETLIRDLICIQLYGLLFGFFFIINFKQKAPKLRKLGVTSINNLMREQNSEKIGRELLNHKGRKYKGSKLL